jgi:hypothetical protein
LKFSFPPSFHQKPYLEKLSVLGGYVFQKGNCPMLWVFVSERIEHEVVFRDESVAIVWHPL